MTPIIITDKGISIKSFNEIAQELREDWVSAFGGETIDLSSSSPDGLEIDLKAKEIRSVSELVQAVSSKLTLEGSSGVWVDIFMSYKGLTRLGSSYSYVYLLFSGSNGTVIPAGTLVNNLFNDQFSTDSEITIGIEGTAFVRATSLSIGPKDVSQGTWSLNQSISGISSVIVENDGVIGRFEETDAEFKARAKNTVHDGLATLPTIKSYIENNVHGITSVSVVENETSSTDINGRPPHSIEVMVLGGSDEEIARAIFMSKPAGIKAYGTHIEGDGYLVFDSNGGAHYVNWSILNTAYLWINVAITHYEEEILPDNYSELIKQAIVEWAETEYTFGKDVIPKRICVPVYSVAGIEDVTITVAVTYNSETTPSEYVDTKIQINEAFAVIATTERIAVTLL